MSGSVTVPGVGGSTITQTFNNQFNHALAQSIANALAAASSAGSLHVTAVTGNNPAIPPPSTAPGSVNELILSTVTGSITIPTGYSFVVDNGAGPDTIFGTPNLSIMGGGGTHTVIDPALMALGDAINPAPNNVTVTGAGDNVAVGNGINTITGEGSGTLSGGLGTNTFVLNVPSLSGSYLINSEGLGGDTIFGGDGAITINGLAVGLNLSVVGGKGALEGHFAGNGTTLLGGRGASDVTVSGSGSNIQAGRGDLTASVSGSSDTIIGASFVTVASGAQLDRIVGGGNPLTVLDFGTGDTIVAGAGAAAITAAGGSFVQGGAGPLSFVGGTGGSTILGGSGAATVFGSTGDTTLTGAAGGSFTYFNFTTGTVNFQGGNGNETMDASVSKARAIMTGSLDTTGGDLLMGGAGNDLLMAGKGSDTLVGGGGANTLDVFASNGSASAHHVVGDFSSIDTMVLVGYAFGTARDAIAGATVANGSTTITLPDSTTITFTGVTDPGALTGHVHIPIP